VADEQVEVVEAEAVRDPRDGVPEADEPEVVLAAQGEVAGLVWLAEHGEELGHAAVGRDGTRLGQRR
jgi:hypothetical protein